MLFDQFGNYVVQRLFKIAIDVCSGRREGDQTWFATIAKRVRQSESSLRRYSSGKKLLYMLADLVRPTPLPYAAQSMPPQFMPLSAATATMSYAPTMMLQPPV